MKGPTEKPRKRRDFIFFLSSLAATLGWLGFIYSNSLKSAPESGEQSSRVLALIRSLARFVGYEGEVTEHFVRKLAHFTEFAILSLLVCLSVFTLWRVLHKETASRDVRPLLWVSMPLCMLLASVDEWLQTFSDGRAAELADVLLDTCGAALATLCLQGLITFCLFVRKNTKNREKDV